MSVNIDSGFQGRPGTVRDNILESYDSELSESISIGTVHEYQVPSPLNKQFIGKRFFDIVVGGLVLLVCFLIFPFIALGIKLSSKGNIIFKQRRTGLNGNAFVCYKFRTMHSVQKKITNGQPDITEKGDIRVFAFGGILRKTNLDELPQIINVIKGEMSLVGPRPYPIEECRHWNNTFDDFYYRYLVKPGITGFAQITGYRGGTLDEEHMRKRLDKDLIYIQKKSFWMDIKIIVLTVKQMVFLKTNAH